MKETREAGSVSASKNTSEPLTDKCFMCERPLIASDEWMPESLKYILENLFLCQDHAAFCEKRIKEFELNKPPEAAARYFLKPFVPKKVEPGKNFIEREPGSDDE